MGVGGGLVRENHAEIYIQIYEIYMKLSSSCIKLYIGSQTFLKLHFKKGQILQIIPGVLSFFKACLCD